MAAREINFDGLVGPSHNYGGVSFGNVASEAHRGEISKPREAALQGLAKMRALHRLGVPQAVLPPHMRPDLSLARRMGFSGDDRAVLAALARDAPLLLAACYSAAAMWTANAATVRPSADGEDGKVHFTPANLQNKVHRWIEAPATARILEAVFPDRSVFEHHPALPTSASVGDEGAANHTRLAPAHEAPGLHLFVYGESATDVASPRPKVFPARQTREASEALARLHRLPGEQVVFAQQNPDVIDRGVFHNDVISVGHLDLFLHHEEAFVDGARVIDELRSKYRALSGRDLRCVAVTSGELGVDAAVRTYLFNSQIVSRPGGRVALIATRECEEDAGVRAVVDRLVREGHLDEVHFFDLRQSMQGGGGPACLRLRVVLTEAEEAAMAPGVRFTDELDAKLVAWIERHYRPGLAPRDLADLALVEESRVALDELTQILGVGSIYPFQTEP